MKVHIIEVDNDGRAADVVATRDQLGRAIGALAAQSDEIIWFHDYKEPVAGIPVIILECTDAFLEKVSKLPDFKKSHEAESAPGKPDTERSKKIQNYFTSTSCKYVNYYSLEFTRSGCVPYQHKDKMSDVFNFQKMIRQAHEAFLQVMDYLSLNNLLHQVADIQSVCNENRMVLRCPDALAEELKGLSCIKNVRPLTAQEIQALHPCQKPPRPPQA